MALRSTEPLTVLALCAGYGGLDLGVRMVRPGIRLVGVVERQAYAAAVLASRMVEGSLDSCPIWDDLESFDCASYRDRVDLIVAGFPCQGASVAGKRLGTEDARWLWPEVWRITKATNARWLFAENVPGLLSVNGGGAFEEILGDLGSSGWSARWDCVPAGALGAPHVRDRLFLLATDANRVGVRLEPERDQRQGGDRERPSAGTASLMTRARRGQLPTPTTRPNNHRSGHDAHGKSDRGKTLLETATLTLPTPNASDAKGGLLSMSDREHHDGSLSEALSRKLPTPRASDATKGTRSLPERSGKEGPTLPEAINILRERRTLPTPTAQDARASGVAVNWTKASGRNAGATLTDVAGATLTDVAVRGLDTSTNKSTSSSPMGEPTGIGGGRLNPSFVEWMMGLPPGWTKIPMPKSSTSSVTAAFHTRRRSRLPSSGSVSTAQLSLLPTDE